MSAEMRGGVGLMCPNREPLVPGTETVLCLPLTPPPPSDPEIKPKERGQEDMFHLSPAALLKLLDVHLKWLTDSLPC